MDKKVAITKNGIDLIRIIPLERDESSFEIKITPLTKQCTIRINKLLDNGYYPQRFEFETIEFTYHVKTEKNGTKIHAKFNNGTYKTLELTELIDLSHDFDFPIPLFKMMLPFNKEKIKEFKKRKEHIPLDLMQSNIAEFYLVNVGSLADNPQVSELVITQLINTSLEFYAHNQGAEDVTKANFFKNELKKQKHRVSSAFKINERLKLIVITYVDSTFNEEETYTFIDNKYSQDILLLTHIYPKKLNKESRTYEYIEMRGCTLSDVKNALVPRKNDTLPKNTFVNFLYKQKYLSDEINKQILKAGIESKIRMHSLLSKVQQEVAEADFVKMDTLYRKLKTIDANALELSREKKGKAIETAIYGYISSFGLSMIKDIYLQNTNSAGFLLTLRCLIEGIAVLVYSEKHEISAEHEDIFRLQAYDTEKRIYEKYPVFDEVMFNLETITSNFNETMGHILKQYDLTVKQVKKTLESKVPTLGNIKSFEKLIKDSLPKRYFDLYKIISLYIHPHDYRLDDTEFFKGYYQELLGILETLFMETEPAEHGLDYEYDMAIAGNEYGKRQQDLTRLQVSKLGRLCEMIDEINLNFLSFSLNICRNILLDYFSDITTGYTEQSTTKWKTAIESLWLLNYCINDEFFAKRNVLIHYHSLIMESNNVGVVAAEDLFLKAYDSYKSKYPKGADFNTFKTIFTRTTGYTINEQGETITLTRAVFSLIDELAPHINGGKMPAAVKEGPFKKKDGEDKNTAEFDIASYLKMKYEESQAMSHATGYLYYCTDGAWHDGNVLAYLYDELLQVLLEKLLDNLKIMHKAKKINKTIVNFLRNFIEENSEYINEKKELYFVQKVPKNY